MVSMRHTGIEMRHYRTISLDETNAETFTRNLTEQMEEDKIPWRQKMIATMTDGCNTMAGCRSGVKIRFEQMIPQMKDFGSCNDHHLGNAAQAGCEALDSDVREVLVNIYFDLGGAKGKGLKKKPTYESFSKEKGRKLKALCKEPVAFGHPLE